MNAPTERSAFRTARDIAAAVSHLKDICGEDDEQLLADMIEGEVDLEGYVDTVSKMIADDEATCEALAVRAKQMTTRKARISKRAERLRTLLATVLDDSGTKTITTPEATVTVTRLKPGIIIEEEADIPVEWWKRQDPTLNKPGLRKHLNDRREALESISDEAVDKESLRAEIDKEFPEVPGVSLDNGELSLKIRRA
jgi:hypothetical protein